MGVKPILVLKQKCRECIGSGDESIDAPISFPYVKCKSCSGIGTQETEIYALRDFEKRVRDRSFIGAGSGRKSMTGVHIEYKIPKEYEPYEIRKVSEIDFILNEQYKQNLILI